MSLCSYGRGGRAFACALLLSLAAGACSESSDDGECPMESLTGSWKVQYTVTSVSGNRDGCMPCPPDNLDCHGCCQFGFQVPEDVSGFFVNATRNGDDEYNGHPLEVTTSSISPPDCIFSWSYTRTQPRAGSWTTSIDLTQRSPTELGGRALYRTGGVWGTLTCEADVVVTKQ